MGCFRENRDKCEEYLPKTEPPTNKKSVAAYSHNGFIFSVKFI